MAPEPATNKVTNVNNSVKATSRTYPRPPSIRSPFKQQYGLGLTSKPGEVYVGTEIGKGARNVPLDTFATAGAYASLSPAAQRKLWNDGQKIYGKGMLVSYMDNFLKETAERAYAVQQSTGLKVTPLNYWDYYAQSGGPGLDAASRSGAGGGGGGGGVAAPRTTTSKSRQVSTNLSDPTTARGLVDGAIQQYLGRLPTNEEYQSFLKQLNAAQEKAPSVTTQTATTTTSVGGSTTKSKARTTGGLNEQQFAAEYARGMEGAAEYTAATTVADAFISLLME